MHVVRVLFTQWHWQLIPWQVIGQRCQRENGAANSLLVTGSHHHHPEFACLRQMSRKSCLVIRYIWTKLAIARTTRPRRSRELQKMTKNGFHQHLFLPSWLAFPGIWKTPVEPQMTKIPTWTLQRANGQHHVESFGASIYTMSYVFYLSFYSQSTKGQQRAVRIQLWPVPVPESPLPRWLWPEPATINHVALCVRPQYNSPSHSCIIGHPGVADEFAPFFLIFLLWVVNSFFSQTGLALLDELL